jgi:glycine betaine/proline transport system substrate-binding protein
MSYMQAQVLEDSLNVPVDLKEVQGGGIAFSSVANGDRDFFNEAWLPTTHQNSWGDLHEQLQKLGYTYRGTSGGAGGAGLHGPPIGGQHRRVPRGA